MSFPPRSVEVSRIYTQTSTQQGRFLPDQVLGAPQSLLEQEHASSVIQRSEGAFGSKKETLAIFPPGAFLI